MNAIPILLALAALAPPVDDDPDTVVLKNGRDYEGRVVYLEDDGVVLRDGSRLREWDRDEVDSVESILGSLRELIDRLEAGTVLDVDGLLDLARYCEAHDLPGERELLLLKALLLEPDHPEVNEALEARERRGHLSIKLGGDWFRTEDLAGVRPEWGDAWELRTTHYDVRSNQRLGDAIDVAIDLERFRRAFYAIFAEPLHLLDFVDEMMLVTVHADDASYPEPGDGRKGYLDTAASTPTLRLKAKGAVDRGLLVHEATHQLHYMITQRSRKARGIIPTWVDEGLGELLEAGVNDSRQGPIVDAGGHNETWFRKHANASEDDRYDLANLLNFQVTDFRASTGRELKYAEAYTLVHFFLLGENGKYAARFIDFLEGCYRGRASQTDLQDVMDMDLDELEEAWLAHVRRMAA